MDDKQSTNSTLIYKIEVSQINTLFNSLTSSISLNIEYDILTVNYDNNYPGQINGVYVTGPQYPENSNVLGWVDRGTPNGIYDVGTDFVVVDSSPESDGYLDLPFISWATINTAFAGAMGSWTIYYNVTYFAAISISLEKNFILD